MRLLNRHAKEITKVTGFTYLPKESRISTIMLDRQYKLHIFCNLSESDTQYIVYNATKRRWDYGRIFDNRFLYTEMPKEWLEVISKINKELTEIGIKTFNIVSTRHFNDAVRTRFNLTEGRYLEDKITKEVSKKLGKAELMYGVVRFKIKVLKLGLKVVVQRDKNSNNYRLLTVFVDKNRSKIDFKHPLIVGKDIYE